MPETAAATPAPRAPSDVAHDRIKGKPETPGTQDTEATKAAREAAFGKPKPAAKPDTSSKAGSTKSPAPKGQ